MRFVLARLQHETNTFSPVATPLACFAIGSRSGEPSSGPHALHTFAGTNTALAGFIDFAHQLKAEVALPIAANAAPSGPVADTAFEQMAQSICSAVEHGCDAVLLDLHGAMVTESHSDGEGVLLARLRRLAPDLPIAVSLDFHANMSPAIIEHATVIAGYRTYPHVDMYDTATRTTRMLRRILDGELAPLIRWGKCPMLTHTLCQSPADQPMKDIMDRAILASGCDGVIDVSVFGGFPLADIPHVGLTALAVADQQCTVAETVVSELLELAWERRAEFVYQVEPVSDALERAKGLEGNPIVLVDHGDNVNSGGTQDVMSTVAEALEQGLEDLAIGPICDPEAVQLMISAGVDQPITRALGGKTAMPALGLEGQPLEVSGTVRRITDGRYEVTCPMLTGITLDHGPSAVLDTGTAEILVCSERVEPFDLGVFRHAGIEPTAKRYILLKSRQNFRAGFEPIAAHIVLLAGPGVASSDYDLFSFEQVPRPLYPLNLDTEYYDRDPPDRQPCTVRIQTGDDDGT